MGVSPIRSIQMFQNINIILETLQQRGCVIQLISEPFEEFGKFTFVL